MVRAKVLVLFLLIGVESLSGQTTNTDCTLWGNHMNCSSRHSSPPPTLLESLAQGWQLGQSIRAIIDQQEAEAAYAQQLRSIQDAQARAQVQAAYDARIRAAHEEESRHRDAEHQHLVDRRQDVVREGARIVVRFRESWARIDTTTPEAKASQAEALLALGNAQTYFAADDFEHTRTELSRIERAAERAEAAEATRQREAEHKKQTAEQAALERDPRYLEGERLARRADQAWSNVDTAGTAGQQTWNRAIQAYSDLRLAITVGDRGSAARSLQELRRSVQALEATRVPPRGTP